MNSTSTTATDSATARALYVLAVACFPLVLAVGLTQLVFATGIVQRDDGIGHKTEFAEFSYPTPGDLVGDQFVVQGLISAIPTDGVIYLVERSEGRFWPKKKLDTAQTSFSREQYATAGAGYKYTIELLAFDADGEAVIDQWYATGKETGKYPGLSSVDGARVLAKTRVIHR